MKKASQKSFEYAILSDECTVRYTIFMIHNENMGLTAHPDMYDRTFQSPQNVAIGFGMYSTKTTHEDEEDRNA